MKERVVYYDLLNIAACISVVALHCNYCFWEFSYDSYWKTSIIIETVCYWAVPIFYMLSGANLIDYSSRYSTKEFFIKRMTKIGVPFVFWTVLTLIIRTHGHFNSKEFIDSFNTIYWFFPPLFALYFSTPVLASIPDPKKIPIFQYMILLSVLSFSVYPFLMTIAKFPINSSWQTVISAGYMLFYLLGYVLSKVKIERKIRILIYALGIIGILTRSIGIYFTSYQKGAVDSTFSGYLNFPSLFLALAVWIFFQYHTVQFSPKVGKYVSRISSASFGIYLIQAYFAYNIPHLFGFSHHSIVWRTLGSIGVYFICLIIVLALKRIPIIKRVVP